MDHQYEDPEELLQSVRNAIAEAVARESGNELSALRGACITHERLSRIVAEGASAPEALTPCILRMLDHATTIAMVYMENKIASELVELSEETDSLMLNRLATKHLDLAEARMQVVANDPTTGESLIRTLTTPLEEIGLSTRTLNAIRSYIWSKHEGTPCVKDLISMNRDELACVWNIGKSAIEEVETLLATHGLALADNDVENPYQYE